MAQLERITTKDHAGTKLTKDVDVISESDKFIFAWVIDKQGSNTDLQWLIDVGTIQRRVPLRVNKTYCEIEVVK